MKCLNHNETVDYIINNNCGVSRFGDGPLIALMSGRTIKHPTGEQSGDNDLGERLKNVFIESPKTDNHLLCVPLVYTKEHLQLAKDYSAATNPRSLWPGKFRLRDAMHAKVHQLVDGLDVKPRVLGCKAFNRIRYAHDSSLDGVGYIKKIAHIFKDKYVFHVSGYAPFVMPEGSKKSRHGEDGALCPILEREYFKLAKKVEFLQCPKSNSYEKYNSILENCIFHASKHNPKDVLFHLSFGPAASVMSLELCKQGFQALDMGLYHLLENLKEGVV